MHCTMVTPATITTLTLEHTELTYLKIHLVMYSVLWSKLHKNVGDRNSGEFHTRTHKQTRTLNFDLDRQAGLHGFVDWIVVQGWGRALLYWVTIFAKISVFNLLFSCGNPEWNQFQHLSMYPPYRTVVLLRTHSVALYIQGIEQTQRQNKEKKKKGNVIISRVVLETVKS